MNSDWTPAKLVVLVDDVRSFRDGRPCRIARTPQQALDLLDELAGTTIDELWLDYDLGSDLTVDPVVRRMVEAAQAGQPVKVHRIMVHSKNTGGAHRITQALRGAGYPVEGYYTLGTFVT